MGLCADPNDPYPAESIFAPPKGLSFRFTDAVPSGKSNILGFISLSGNLWWKNSGSFSVSLLAENWIYCTFTGLLVYNIQAVNY